MNISIHDFNKDKTLELIYKEFSKTKDPNIRLGNYNNLIDGLYKIIDSLNKYRDKLNKELSKVKDNVECPHCHKYNNRDDLLKESKTHKYVKGTYTQIIDLGEFDGYDYKNECMTFMWAECKYCHKRIYTPSPESGGSSLFFGRLLKVPILCLR